MTQHFKFPLVICRLLIVYQTLVSYPQLDSRIVVYAFSSSNSSSSSSSKPNSRQKSKPSINQQQFNKHTNNNVNNNKSKNTGIKNTSSSRNTSSSKETKTVINNKNENYSKNNPYQRNSQWAINRKENKIKQTNRKRSPRWEVEGDDLFILVDKDANDDFLNYPLGKEFGDKYDSSTSASELLKDYFHPITSDDSNTKDSIKIGNNHEEQSSQIKSNAMDDNINPATTTSTPKPFMWGKCSVGPVISKQLQSLQLHNPTPIQEEAFTTISSPSKNNVIIASPTGTGKTLAYLLPILCNTNRNQSNTHGSTLIVTPTIDLAYQIQREVNHFWPCKNIPKRNTDKMGNNNNDNTSNNNDDRILNEHAVYVINTNTNHLDDNDHDTENVDENISSRIIEGIRNSQAPIIAGTPKALRQIISFYLRNEQSNNYQSIKGETSLFINLKTVILDEVDRLLRTEAIARMHKLKLNQKQQLLQEEEEQHLKERIDDKLSKKSSSSKNESTFIPTKPSVTELLLSDMERLLMFSSGKVSTTTPRYRSSLAPTLSSTPNSNCKSFNYYSTNRIQLICASATVGRSLRRQIMKITGAPSIDKASVLVCADDRTSKHESKRRSSLLPSTIRHAYYVSDNTNHPSSSTSTSENDEEILVQKLWNMMQELPPKPTIIFPGKKMGAQAIADKLQTTCNIQTENLHFLRGGTTYDKNNNRVSNNFEFSNNKCPQQESSVISSWKKDCPIVLVEERFARGLDIKGIQYVILCTPPSSPAAYTHLAGRTGRGGNDGMAITLVSNIEDAKKVIALSNTLGVDFHSLLT